MRDIQRIAVVGPNDEPFAAFNATGPNPLSNHLNWQSSTDNSGFNVYLSRLRRLVSSLLLEAGDHLLLETSDLILLE